MDWTSIILIILIAIGYTHLLRVASNKSISGLVYLSLQSKDMDESRNYPKQFEFYTKGCPFIITPVPGMEFHPSGVEGGEIKRVIIDEGLIQIYCNLIVSLQELTFEEIEEILENDGWRKKSL